MRTFRFRLERVLGLREAQARVEEAKLEQLRHRLRSLETELENVSRSLDSSHAAIKQSPFVEPFRLAALDQHEARIRREQEQFRNRIATQRQQVEIQKQAVVEARRKVELLKKLRESRRSDWNLGAQRELESGVADFSAAEWNRRRQERLADADELS